MRGGDGKPTRATMKTGISAGGGSTAHLDVGGEEGQLTCMSSGEVPGNRGRRRRAMLTEPWEEAMASSISPEAARSATCGICHASQREVGVGHMGGVTGGWCECGGIVPTTVKQPASHPHVQGGVSPSPPGPLHPPQCPSQPLHAPRYPACPGRCAPPRSRGSEPGGPRS